MRAIEATRKPLTTIAVDATIREAAALMDEHAVGALVVLDGERAAGIVTDRDLVTRAVAHGLPADARVDSVMTTEMMSIDAQEDVRKALSVFREHAIRRLPLTQTGEVVGMLTVDDLLMDVIADLADLARPITGEVIFGHPEPAVPVAPH